MPANARNLLTLSVIIILSAMVAATMWSHKPSPVPSAPHTIPMIIQAKARSHESQWNHYRSDDSGFALRYPPDYHIEAQSPDDMALGKDFIFRVGAATPLRLHVVNLAKYLPKTNTPTIGEYLKTFRTRKKYREAIIGGKTAYEYLSCGSATCTQEVVFVFNNWLYEFSIQALTGDVDPNSISFDNRPPAVREIIESVQFFPSH